MTINLSTNWISNGSSPLYDCDYTGGDRGGSGGDWQLAAGQFAPSRMSLQFVNPNGSEGARSAYLFASTQFDYLRRVTVIGGSPPYMFALQTPISGVSITRRAPTWNPGLYLWADLEIDSTVVTSGSVSPTIVCTDQNGTEITVSITVTVDDTAFVFVDAAAVSSGSGTLASPLQGLDDVYTTSAADTTYQDKILVMRAGTYLVDNFDTANVGLSWNANKPSGWIPYPGESVVFNCDANITNSGVSDQYFGEVEYLGSDASATNARVIALFGSQSNIVIDHPTFTDPVAGAVGNDNTSCIYSSNDGPRSHDRISIINGYWDGLPSASNGVSQFDLFAVYRCAIVGGTLRNSSCAYSGWVKNSNDLVMVAGMDAYSTTNNASRLFYPQQADAGDLVPPGVVQFLGCKGYRPTDGLNSNQIIGGGDSNQNWGTIYHDRMTAVGKARYENGEVNTLGTMNLNRSLIFNNDSAIIPASWVGANNVLGARSEINTYLDANGDVLLAASEYGTVGANFVDAG